MTDAYDIYNAAMSLVNKYGTRDPKKICRKLGIGLYFKDLGECLGLYICKLKRRNIIVNENLSEAQTLMILAHELGHDRLHRKLAKEGAFQELQLFDTPSSTERDANAFAAHLLIDDSELMEYITYYQYDVGHIAGAMSLNPNLVMMKLAEMNRMGHHFNVDYVNAKFLKYETPDGADEYIC